MNIFNNVFRLLGENKAIYPKATSILNIFNDVGDACIFVYFDARRKPLDKGALLY